MDDKIGILLLNTGTPKEPDVKSVRKYLRQFLSDPRVIDIPSIFRWILVNFLIVPFRAPKSAKLYQSIWEKDGSPLLVNSIAFKQKLANKLGRNYAVELGMRYGEPSIGEGLEKLYAAKVKHIKIIPMFPQYASASSGSSIAEALRLMQNRQVILPFEVAGPFYNDELFISAWANLIAKHSEKQDIDHFLFSFHGIPERQLTKLEDSRFCYRDQCYETAHLIAKKLGLKKGRYSVSFQSRLGSIPWTQPYTDKILPTIIKEYGARRLAVISPSFVADCLETLEELGVGIKERWLELGGEKFLLVPSLNADDAWVDVVIGMI